MRKRLLASALLASLGWSSIAQATEDVHQLIHHLRSGDIDEKERAAQELGEMGPAAEPAIGALQEALNDDLPYVRIRSAEALAKIGTPALPALIKAMKNVNAEVKTAAATALGKWGKDDEKAISALTAALHDRELQVRGAAALALGQLGTSAESAIPALREAAKDSDATVAAEAEEALTRVTGVTIGKKEAVRPAAVTAPPPAPREKPVSVPKLTKKKTVTVLPKLVKKPKVILPPPPPPTPEELIVKLQSTDIFVRADAETAIVRRSSETTPLLIQDLQTANTTQAQLYVDSLGKIGTEDAKKALEAYHKHLDDKKMTALIRDLRQEGKPSEDASAALVRLGAPAVIPVSLVLSDPKLTSRQAAAKILNRLGPISAPATNALIIALDDSDPTMRAQCYVALSAIDTPEAKKAIRYFPIKDKIHRLLAIFHY